MKNKPFCFKKLNTFLKEHSSLSKLYYVTLISILVSFKHSRQVQNNTKNLKDWGDKIKN